MPKRFDNKYFALPVLAMLSGCANLGHSISQTGINSGIRDSGDVSLSSRADAFKYISQGELNVDAALDNINALDDVSQAMAVSGGLGTAIGGLFGAKHAFILGSALFGGTGLVLNQTNSISAQRTVLQNALSSLGCIRNVDRRNFPRLDSAAFDDDIDNISKIVGSTQSFENTAYGAYAKASIDIQSSTTGMQLKAQIDLTNANISLSKRYLSNLSSGEVLGAAATAAAVDQVLSDAQQQLNGLRPTAQSAYNAGASVAAFAPASSPPPLKPSTTAPGKPSGDNAAVANAAIDHSLDAPLKDLIAANDTLKQVVTLGPVSTASTSPGSDVTFDFSACKLTVGSISAISVEPSTVSVGKGASATIVVTGGQGSYTAVVIGSNQGITISSTSQVGYYNITAPSIDFKPANLRVTDGIRTLDVPITEQASTTPQ